MLHQRVAKISCLFVPQAFPWDPLKAPGRLQIWTVAFLVSKWSTCWPQGLWTKWVGLLQDQQPGGFCSCKSENPKAFGLLEYWALSADYRGVKYIFAIPTLTSSNWTMILDGETLLLSSKFLFNWGNISRVIIIFCFRRGKHRMICAFWLCVFWLCVFCYCIIFLKKYSYTVILCISTTTEILHENHQALLPFTPASDFTDWRLNTDH